MDVKVGSYQQSFGGLVGKCGRKMEQLDRYVGSQDGLEWDILGLNWSIL